MLWLSREASFPRIQVSMKLGQLYFRRLRGIVDLLQSIIEKCPRKRVNSRSLADVFS